MKNRLLIIDKQKYIKYGEKTSIIKNHSYRYVYLLRKYQQNKNLILKKIIKLLIRINEKKYGLEIPCNLYLGGGFYLGHAYNITINPNVIIGNNVSLHKGATIGAENRGNRMGAPIIGDNVWIGSNAVIVGKIKIGNNVLIASNSFVNINVPNNSIVFGNPCIIKQNEKATEQYL